ncbi:MAG TPA: M3 family metallopeptidase, partial [Phycisphaerae bacterium]|nr:M3 family metallopeptidase [Phycisphaerae bacterium]
MNNTLRLYRRQYVQAGADMGDWSHIEPYFDELDRRPIDTKEALERWLLDQSDLAACLDEEVTRRRVAMTCHTDDAAIETAFLHVVENVVPRCKPRWQRLRARYVASPARTLLPRDRYFVHDRSTASAVEIFREENVPLETETEKLDQQYKKLCGAMTVQYDGKEQTLQQMCRYLEEPDRTVRQTAWKLMSHRRLKDREAIDDIFDGMMKLRGRMAANAGFPNFRDYQFRVYERFDYTPADCFAFHEAIEKVVVPADRALQEDRRRRLGVDTLRPWDLRVNPGNRPPLKPFATAVELCTGCSTIFHRLDDALGDRFDLMVRENWLDLESRRGKAPGGYLT